ncbi:MAG: hypothetical protein WBL90_02240 [bacterium]|jgi:hypothetical protein
MSIAQKGRREEMNFCRRQFFSWQDKASVPLSGFPGRLWIITGKLASGLFL